MSMIKMGAIVLDSNDPDTLADFYAKLLGWQKVVYNEEWVMVLNITAEELASGERPAEGMKGREGLPLVIQRDPDYIPPTWPTEAGKQQQMTHLDMYVDDVAEAVEYALGCGARLNPVQMDEHWRVMLDPSGHTFCILPLKSPED